MLEERRKGILEVGELSLLISLDLSGFILDLTQI
jgi:hypothetical protein